MLNLLPKLSISSSIHFVGSSIEWLIELTGRAANDTVTACYFPPVTTRLSYRCPRIALFRTALAGKALTRQGGLMNKQELVKLFAVVTAAIPGLLLSASIASAQATSSDGF